MLGGMFKGGVKQCFLLRLESDERAPLERDGIIG